MSVLHNTQTKAETNSFFTKKYLICSPEFVEITYFKDLTVDEILS